MTHDRNLLVLVLVGRERQAGGYVGISQQAGSVGVCKVCTKADVVWRCKNSGKGKQKCGCKSTRWSYCDAGCRSRGMKMRICTRERGRGRRETRDARGIRWGYLGSLGSWETSPDGPISNDDTRSLELYYL